MRRSRSRLEANPHDWGDILIRPTSDLEGAIAGTSRDATCVPACDDPDAGGFVEPPGLPARLEAPFDGYSPISRDGTRWTFDAAGRLSTQEDLNGHVVSLQRFADG